MSDGNFNRNLLPYNNYQSGLRAGKAQMKHIALESFKEWLSQNCQDWNEDAITKAKLDFKAMLE